MCTDTSLTNTTTSTAGPYATMHLPAPDFSTEPTVRTFSETPRSVATSFDSLATYGALAAAVTEFKLPPERVSTTTEGCPSVEATQKQCEAILKPISEDVRRLMLYKVYGVASKENAIAQFEKVLHALITCSVAGNRLWKLQMDQVMKCSSVDEMISAYFRKNTKHTPEQLGNFFRYIAPRKSPISACLFCVKYMLPDKTSDEFMKPIVQNCLNDQTTLLQPMGKTIFLDSLRKYQEVVIKPVDWSRNDIEQGSPLLKDLLWNAVWQRILVLKEQFPNQPLQITIIGNLEELGVCSDFIHRLKEAAHENEIFTRTIRMSKDGMELSYQPPPEGNIFERGLRWETLEQSNELLEYLEEKGLLTYEAASN